MQEFHADSHSYLLVGKAPTNFFKTVSPKGKRKILAQGEVILLDA
jgi:hypothetical protein